MKNLNNLPQESENQNHIIKKESLSLSIALAIERTNTPVFNIDNMVEDILKEFKNVEKESLVKAIRNGSLGLYGQTYKFSTQEVCIWIRRYQKSQLNNRNNGITF